jgi:hypothetical protein
LDIRTFKYGFEVIKVLSYASEARTIRTDERRLISAEMSFLRRTAGYTHWDHKRNEDILTELQISHIT